MKTYLSKVAAVLALGLFLAQPDAAAQTRARVAVFFSGYGVIADPVGDVWTDRKVPDQWRASGMFNKVVDLDPQIRQLLLGATQNRYMQLVNDPSIRTLLISKIQYEVVQQILNYQNTATEVDLVLIGHGPIGGYLARFVGSLAPSLGLGSVTAGSRTLPVRISVVTVGTPHQGLTLADAALSNTSGYRNIDPMLSENLYAIKLGLREDEHSSITLAGILVPLAITLSDVYKHVHWGPLAFDDPLTDYLRGVMRDIRDARSASSAIADNIDAFMYLTYPDLVAADTKLSLTYVKKLVAPGGAVIQTLNGLPDPTYHRSILGEEQQYTPLRLGMDVALTKDPSITYNPVANESDYASKLNSYVDGWLERNADLWLNHTICTIFAAPGCRQRREERAANWRGAANAFRNMDGTWGRMAGFVRYETRTGTRLVYDPATCGYWGDDGGMRIDVLFAQDIGNCLPYSSYREETYQYTATIAEDNDGLISSYRGVWDAGEGVNDLRTNFTYDEQTRDGYPGGYNHFELTRYWRQNTSGVMGPAPPMEQTRRWLLDAVLK